MTPVPISFDHRVIAAPAVRHGIDCRKVNHSAYEDTHEALDDSPVEFNGRVFCGRCHKLLEDSK